MSDKLPKRFGRYEVVDRIGQGGMGFVLRGHDPKLKRQVAIKVVPAHLRAAPTVAERFHREALALARLSHPNIVRVFDAGEENGLLYYVMELLEGQGLDKRRPSGAGAPPAFEPREFVATFSGLAEALSVVHAQNLVHRDIKPANIIAGVPERGPVLTDFGLAWLEDRGHVTQSGLIVGTGRYMAPEQVMGEPPGPLCDIYGLGATMWEYLTGRVPFEHLQGEQLLLARMQVELLPISRVTPDVPAELAAIVDRAVKVAPSERFQSARELGSALRRASKGLDSPGQSQGPPRGQAAPGSSSSPGRQRTQPMTVASAPAPSKLNAGEKWTLAAVGLSLVLAAVLGAAAGYAFMRRHEPAAVPIPVSNAAVVPPAGPARAPERETARAVEPLALEHPCLVARPRTRPWRTMVAALDDFRLLVGWTDEAGALDSSLTLDGGRTWHRAPLAPRCRTSREEGARLAAAGGLFHLAFIGAGARAPFPVQAVSLEPGRPSWSEPLVLGMSRTADRGLGLAAVPAPDGSARLLAAWMGPHKHGIVASWWTAAGKGWSPPETLSGSDDLCGAPAPLGLGGSGVVFWEQGYPGTPGTATRASRTAGPAATWSQGQTVLATSPGEERAFLRATADGAHVLLQWTEKTMPWLRVLMQAESNDGGGRFAAPRSMGSRLSVIRKNDLAMAGKRVWSTWEDGIPREERWATSRDRGRTWSRPRTLFSYVNDSKPGALAVTPRGDCWIAWADEAGQVNAMRLP